MSPSDDRPRKAVSEKKWAANRANARKSTGPKTEAGRARVSLNALTHGMTAATAVLPTENEDHFNKFAAALRAELKPRGFLQTLIAERLVEVAWKQRRVSKALTEHACRRMDADLDGWELAREVGAWNGPDLVMSGTDMLVDSAEGDEEAAAFLRLELYADRLQRAFHQGLTQLRREQRRAEQDAGGDATGNEPAADVPVTLEHDPIENGRFENKATADVDANGERVNLRNYWVDLSVQEALEREKQRHQAKHQNKATAGPGNAAPRDSKPAVKPSATPVKPHKNDPPSPGTPGEGGGEGLRDCGVRISDCGLKKEEPSPRPSPGVPGEGEKPADPAAPVEAAEGKSSGVALAGDVGMELPGGQRGEIDPFRQLPPSHPLYRRPLPGGG